MSHKVSWYLPNAILQATYSGHLSTDDILSSGDKVAELSLATNSRHYLLIDSREVTGLPLNFQPMLQSLSKLGSNPLIICTVVISDNVMLRFFNNLVAKVNRTPTQVFSTLDEAYAYIAHNSPEMASALPTPE